MTPRTLSSSRKVLLYPLDSREGPWIDLEAIEDRNQNRAFWLVSRSLVIIQNDTQLQSDTKVVRYSIACLTWPSMKLENVPNTSDSLTSLQNWPCIKSRLCDTSKSRDSSLLGVKRHRRMICHDLLLYSCELSSFYLFRNVNSPHSFACTEG